MRKPSSRSDALARSARSRRQGLRGWVQSLLGGGEPVEPNRGRLLLESLEPRQLLAGDIELLFTDPSSPASSAAPAQSGGLRVVGQAEGESAPDLVQFAKDLADAGVEYFGAAWCPACTEQKQLFADGEDNLPFIEVTDSQRQLNAIGVAEGITQFPTWKFPSGQVRVGVQTLDTLSQLSGVPIPQSEQPTFEPIGRVAQLDQSGNLNVQIGSPLHVPIDAYDPNGGPLTVTVAVQNPSIIQATVLSGNRSIRIDMNGYEDMVFELFEDRAPVAAGRVATLAQSGFYDGIIFHRVDDDFVIQGGDPTGTGTSGSNLGNFDDDFHPDLQHNRSGILSFAKSSDDTNNSQFFITEVPTRFLDFNHSIFGQLVEGFDAREAISEVSTPESRGVSNSQKPDIDVVINSIDVFDDTENSVVMLRALAAGATNVTFTVTDQDGNSHSQTVRVVAVADTANGQPFLNDIATPAVGPVGTPAQLQLTSTDVEGDAVTYFAQSLSPAANGTAQVNATTGALTVTPAPGFSGAIDVRVGVRPGPGVVGNASTDSDTQTVRFRFEGEGALAPTSIDLQTGSDTGSSNIDNITNAGSLSFLVSGVTSGATVQLVNTANGSVVGTGLAAGSTVVITTNNIAALGSGSYQLAARQVVGSNTSNLSPTLTVVYDTLAPASVVSSAVTQANVSRPYVSDLVSPEEGSGLAYAFSAAPTGATIASSTGVINWTPTTNQVGPNTFSLQLTDAAGNVRTESFTVTVAAQPLAEIRLEIANLAGTPISSVSVGDTFLLRMYGVDARSFVKSGIYGAFADVLFDNSLVRPVAGSTITYNDDFTLVRKGTFATGLIDELGAINQGLVATNDAESLIATVRMQALASGTASIRSEPADESSSEFLLFGLDDLVPAGSVFYGSATLAIGRNFTSAPDTFTVNEDAASTVLDVLANDVVVSGSGTLSVVGVSQPASGGTVTLTSGAVRFTPAPNFNGPARFTYRLSDSGGVQEDVSVTVNVTSVNDPPDGRDDEFTVDRNTTNNRLDVLANDRSDPDTGETLRVTLGAPQTTTRGGTVSITTDGRAVNYTPASGFVGSDTFTYTVSDGGLTDVVTVNVIVAQADNAPSADDDAFPVTEDAAEASFDVLANDDRDIDNQTFVIESVGTPSQGGSVRFSSDGAQFFYRPATNFAGTEVVTYTIRDTGGGRSIGTVTFTVSAVNDAPPIASPTVGLLRGSSESSVFDLTDLPANVDANETLTISQVSTATTAGGTARIDTATQSIRYTPPSATFVGSDTITYTIRDAAGLTSNGVITLNVADFTQRDIAVTLPSTAIGNQINGITLTGTNLLGQSVSLPLSYSSSGAMFANVLPGSYTIQIPAIPFLQNASTARQIPVTSAAEDGDMVVPSQLGQLRPEYLSIRDFVGSAPVKSILVAVAPGQTSLLTQVSPTFNAVTSPVVALDAAGRNLTIRGRNSSAAEVTATLPTSSDRRVELRGEVDGLRLLKISVEDGDVTFTPVPVTSNQTVAAESESLVDQPLGLRVAEASSLLFGDVQAEGESLVAAATTQADLFVPLPPGISARTDATVLSLAEGELWLGESLRDSSQPQPLGSQSVDEAMQQVAAELSLLSPTGEALAEELAGDSGLDSAAIDAVLHSPL